MNNTTDMRPRKMPPKPKMAKPEPKRSHHKRKPVTEPMVDAPPPGVVPPMPQVYSNEDDPPLNLDCSDPKPESEPWWHSHLFIVGLAIVVLVVMIVGIAWSMKP